MQILAGHIGRTFEVQKEVYENRDPFAIRADTIPGEDDSKIFNPNHETYKESKWCYDTPGTVNNDQILTLLTIEELMVLNTHRLLKPCLLYTSPSPRDRTRSRMPSSA